MSIVDKFKENRARAQAEMTGRSLNGNRIFSGANEIQLCGSKNSGMTFGSFISDINEAPYRIIKDYRAWRINKEVADKYGIKNFNLRICDPSQYQGATEEELAVVNTLSKVLDTITDSWSAWEGKVAKYPPVHNKHMTIQYMKVTRRTGSDGADISNFQPGVKVIMSRSDSYFRAFDGYIDSQQMITGGMDFVNNLLSREVTRRSSYHMIKVSLPPKAKSYDVSIQEISKPVEITDEDLKVANDLNREVVNITPGGINVEELKKWVKMITDTYNSMKKGVEGKSADVKVEAPKPVQRPEPTTVAKPAPAEPLPFSDDDDVNPFAD